MSSHIKAGGAGAQGRSIANWSCLVGLVLLGATFGCSDNSGLAPVSGLITVDGKPVAAAQVLFMSPNHRPAAGETDAQGRYVLSTYTSGDGAAIGTHSVTVTARPTIRVSPTGGGPPTGRPTIQHGAKSPLPLKYSDPSNPVLSVEVQPGVNDIPLELSQK